MLDDILLRLGIRLDYTRELIVASLVLIRTMTMLFLTPFLGGKLAPGVVKMGFGGILSLLLWPTARASLTGPIPVEAFPVLVLFMKEVFIGVVIGFINMEAFFIMEIAGRLIDTFRGTAMAEVMVPHSQGRSTVVGDMYYHLLLIFFMALGGHNIFLEAYAYSFQLIPVDSGFQMAWATSGFFEFMMKMTNEMLLLAVLLALPVGAATLITDIVFGLLNRVAPQMNAYFMAMPVKAMGGLAVTLVIMDAFYARIREYVVWSLQAVEHAIELLGGRPIL